MSFIRVLELGKIEADLGQNQTCLAHLPKGKRSFQHPRAQPVNRQHGALGLFCRSPPLTWKMTLNTFRTDLSLVRWISVLNSSKMWNLCHFARKCLPGSLSGSLKATWGKKIHLFLAVKLPDQESSEAARTKRSIQLKNMG